MSDAPHPFSIPNFQRLWASRFASMLAQYALLLILGWQAYNLAREDLSISASAGILGLIGLLQFIPLFLLTPVTGWAADKWDRRWISRIILIGHIAIAATMAVLTYQEKISLNVIYVVAILLGICRAFLGPAQSALTPNIVPKESLPRAIALSTIAWQVGVIVGPAFSGPLYGIAPYLPYAVCAFLYLFALAAMMMIGPQPRSIVDASKGPLRQLTDGLRYVSGNKLVLGAITLDLFVMFLAGAQAMIPVFARDILQVGELGLSALAAAPAIGGAITAFWLSWKPISSNVGVKMLFAMAGFGIGTIGFGLSENLALSMLFLGLCGSADMIGVFVRQSLILLNTPDDKRGRVSAVSQMTISASNELGDAFTGALAFYLGPVIAIVAGGTGAMVIIGTWSKLFPQLANAKTFDTPEEILNSEPEKAKKPS